MTNIINIDKAKDALRKAKEEKRISYWEVYRDSLSGEELEELCLARACHLIEEVGIGVLMKRLGLTMDRAEELAGDICNEVERLWGLPDITVTPGSDDEVIPF
jgi:hypothetical protein